MNNDDEEDPMTPDEVRRVSKAIKRKWRALKLLSADVREEEESLQYYCTHPAISTCEQSFGEAGEHVWHCLDCNLWAFGGKRVSAPEFPEAN